MFGLLSYFVQETWSNFELLHPSLEKKVIYDYDWLWFYALNTEYTAVAAFKIILFWTADFIMY